ncbi:DMT family transporter [Micromonospora sp. KC721]|uniref:DMT family transporter n=1 Tax=Micromonospora sp. KC721 TaxID=2530380 RepID=UPI00352F4365
MVFGGLVSAAAYVLVARGITDRVNALTMTAHQSAFGMAVILPFGVAEVVRGGPRLLTGHSAGGWLIALAIGVFGFGASFLLYNFALAAVRAGRAGRAGIILHLLPVFGVLSAVAVLGERIGGWQWCGADRRLDLRLPGRRTGKLTRRPRTGGTAFSGVELRSGTPCAQPSTWSCRGSSCTTRTHARTCRSS